MRLAVFRQNCSAAALEESRAPKRHARKTLRKRARPARQVLAIFVGQPGKDGEKKITIVAEKVTYVVKKHPKRPELVERLHGVHGGHVRVKGKVTVTEVGGTSCPPGGGATEARRSIAKSPSC